MNQPLRNASYTRTYGAPTQANDCWPRFFMDTILDPLATERAGREIYKDVERVEINLPGNPYSKPVQEVTDEQRQRWPEEYARFKKGHDFAVSGTPIDFLPGIRPSMAKELKALDIMTIEQLASLNDHGIQRIAMGGRALVQRAKAYIDEAEANALIVQAQANEEKWERRFAEMELRDKQKDEIIRQMQETVTRLQSATPAAMAAIPAMNDPFELMKMGQQPQTGQSSLAAFEEMPMPAPRSKRAKPAEGAS